METFRKRVIGVFLTTVLCLGLLSGCGPALSRSAKIKTPLVVAYDMFNGDFNPFFADSAHDQNVAGMTQIDLMTTDRNGSVVYNAIEGETVPYNGTDYSYKGPADLNVTINDDGTAAYRVKIRDDIKFSDGRKMTADDIIFTYYVLCDPSYTGPSSLSSYHIVGLQDYQSQTTGEIYAKYEAIAAAIYEAGTGHIASENDTWTQEQQDRFWATFKQVWMGDIQGFVNYFVSSSANEASGPLLGISPDEVVSNEGLRVALGMAALGLGGIAETGVFGTACGKLFDFSNGNYPSMETLYDEIYAMCQGNPQIWAMTSGSDTDVPEITSSEFIKYYGPLDEHMNGQRVENIAGIKKIDSYTVEVTTADYEAPAIYAIFGITVAPLHYYGDKSLYDYVNNQFGFTFGDLSGVRAKASHPVGAGPYKFMKYENRVV